MNSKQLRILFVDDEQSVLDALRRTVRTEPVDWEARFANSGADALGELQSWDPDIIVSDMRMPGMDGAALLEIVAHSYPHTVRVLFSGQWERSSALRISRVAHRFLSKPLTTEQLLETISALEEACLLLPERHLRAVAGRESLPIAPHAYESLAKAIALTPTNTEVVARAIESDPALSAHVLHLAHSAFFGNPIQSLHTEDAVQALGINTLHGFLQSDGIRRAAWPRMQPDVVAEQRRSLVAARIAARMVPACKANDAYIAALLGGVGNLLLASCEIPIIERDAAAISSYLMRIWGLPSLIDTSPFTATARQLAAGETPVGTNSEWLAIAAEERAAADEHPL